MALDSLQYRTERLRESLQWSNSLATDACSVLDQYAQRVADLERLIQPIAVRTQALTQARENIQKAREKAEEVLDHLDTSRKLEARILQGPKADLETFLRALEKLEAAITFLNAHRSLHTAEDALRSASELRRDALGLCLEDFALVLRENSVVPSSVLATSQAFNESPHARSSAAASGEAENEIELLPAAVLPRLDKLAAAMLRNGETTCFKVYCEVRRGVVERTLQGLGNQYSSADDFAKMAWPALEKKIQGWILAMRVLVRLLVAEGRLAGAVFRPPYDEAAFSEVIAKSTSQLAQFGEAIVHARRAPEKVFGLLDMHENLEAQLPLMFEVLEGSTCLPLLQDCVLLNFHLQQEARATFQEFEASILRDSSKHPVADGTVHPLAAYTLSFLKRLFTYKSAIGILFGDSSSDVPPTLTAARRALREGGGGGLASEALVGRLERILSLLGSNLEAKARAYKNKALAALFLMNNTHYMVKTVEASDALMVLGSDWVERHKDQVEQYGEEYQSLSWGPLMRLVQEDGAALSANWAKEKKTIKDKFKALNAAIQSLHESQSTWTIPDSMLRNNMKDAIAEDFLPLYQDFLERYKAIPFSKAPDQYIKYQVEDIQNMLLQDFFEMKEVEATGRSQSSFLRIRSASSRMAKSSIYDTRSSMR